MTPDDLAAIRQRHDAVTELPWGRVGFTIETSLRAGGAAGARRAGRLVSVTCYCGARWFPHQERRGEWRGFAWFEWWRHHGGPLRKCGGK